VFLFSGSDVAAIRGVIESRTDLASPDSVALAGFLQAYPNFKDDLHVISSLGPLPIYPIVLNSRLPGKCLYSGHLKHQLTNIYMLLW